jgi:Flp pilus assembly protein TadB
MKFYTRFAAFLPKKIEKSFEEQIVYADVEVHHRNYIGFAFFLSICAGFVLFLIAPLLHFPIWLAAISALLAFFLIFASFYAHLLILADSKAKHVEEVLPDALQLISANIRAGMTIDKAVWLCAKPEFGVFEKELRMIAAKVVGGKPFGEALMETTKRVKSAILEKAFRLIVEGIELGGAIANLLSEISADVKNTQLLQKEINATVAMYTMFIVFASVLAAPMLFAVSTFYVQTTTKLWSEQITGVTEQFAAVGTTGPKLFSVGAMAITYDEVIMFSIACILITTFFGALTIGLIKHGAAKRGIKYAPLFVSIALLIYYGGYIILKSMFGALLR